MRYVKSGLLVLTAVIFATSVWAATAAPKKATPVKAAPARHVVKAEPAIAPKVVKPAEVKRTLKAEGLTLGMTLVKMEGEGAYHLSVMAKDAKGKVVEGATISYEFVERGKAITSGELMSMEGHYGSDVQIAKRGSYELKLTVKVGEKTSRAATAIALP